jgi:hypothetical protein
MTYVHRDADVIFLDSIFTLFIVTACFGSHPELCSHARSLVFSGCERRL